MSENRTVVEKVEVDPELIQDFFLEFTEAYENIVNTLVSLENDPRNKELINALFRSIHSIKSNLRMVGLSRISDIIHVLETTFDDIRHSRVAYDKSLSDVFLLSMDRIKTASEKSFEQQPIGFSIDELEVAIAKINDAHDEKSRKKYVQQAILYLDPSVKVTEEKTVAVKHQNNRSDIEKDLQFFASLSTVLEERSAFWQGRTARTLVIAQAMNEVGGDPVDPLQLQAAIYLHDLGMAFFPINMIHKKDKLTDAEHDMVQQHPIDAYLLLRRVTVSDEWDDAAEIVLQHHEWFDGSGYPKGLSGDKICAGAKILSIVDTYEAMTHAQALKTNLKRPLIRAVMEMNTCASTQFDPVWVNHFNSVIQTMNKEGKLK